MLLSETIDGRSQATLEDSVRDLNDTNTAIYAFGFPVRRPLCRTKQPNQSGPAEAPITAMCTRRVGALAGLRPGLLSVVAAELGSYQTLARLAKLWR